LPALDPLLPQVLGNAEANVVVLERTVANDDGVSKRTLPKQKLLICARSEIDRTEIPSGDFSVHRHGKRGADEWS
jgi:hypothetical protein